MAISSVTPVTPGSAISEATPAAPVAPTAGVTDAQTKFSGPAQFLGRLQDLMKSDPTQAKQVLGNIANKLRDQAKQDGSDPAKLNGLADRFQRAADSGDLGAIQPGAGPHAGIPRHAHMMNHKAQSAYNSTDTDPMQSVLDNLSGTAGLTVK